MGKDTRAREARDAVPSITTARQSLSDDIARRNTRYMWQMSTRVACFIGAALVDHWTRWLLVAGAVVLPYIAVVLANAGQERPDHASSPFEAPQLPSGAAAAPLGAAGATGAAGSGPATSGNQAAEPPPRGVP